MTQDHAHLYENSYSSEHKTYVRSVRIARIDKQKLGKRNSLAVKLVINKSAAGVAFIPVRRRKLGCREARREAGLGERGKRHTLIELFNLALPDARPAPEIFSYVY